MPVNRGESKVLTLLCFRCAHEYAYVGSTPHPGACPACGSRQVPLSGELVFRDIEVVGQVGSETAAIMVTANDATSRAFEFYLLTGDGDRQASLVRLNIADEIVPLTEEVQRYLPVESALEEFVTAQVDDVERIWVKLEASA